MHGRVIGSAKFILTRKENDKVNEQVETLLAANNADAQALLLRARVKLQDNNAEDAVKDLEEILKKQPSLKSALYYMAQARLALGQVDRSPRFYRRSGKISSELSVQQTFADSGEFCRKRNGKGFAAVE